MLESALHYFCKLKYFDLENLWIISGWGNSRRFFPIHDLDFDSDLVEVLPAIHALMWYSQQRWYEKQSCQGRSWLLLLNVHIWQGYIEWWNDCWSWNVSPKMYRKQSKMLTLSLNCILLSTMRHIWSLTLVVWWLYWLTRTWGTFIRKLFYFWKVHL